MISIFPLWTFHFYVATFQHDLHMKYISLRWYDIPELVVVSSSCSTSGTRRVNLVTNPVISREWGKYREVFTTSGTYPWSFVKQIFHNGQPSHGGDRKMFEVMTSTYDKRDDFNFPIVNIPFICSNIPARPAYGVYISQIRYEVDLSVSVVSFISSSMG
jgi:hypothetical protein